MKSKSGQKSREDWVVMGLDRVAFEIDNVQDERGVSDEDYDKLSQIRDEILKMRKNYM